MKSYKVCVIACLLALAGCESIRYVNQCPVPDAPPPELLEPMPDINGALSKIISISESE